MEKKTNTSHMLTSSRVKFHMFSDEKELPRDIYHKTAVVLGAFQCLLLLNYLVA